MASLSDNETIDAGKAALKELRRGASWKAWLAVGLALQVLRNRAMAEAGSNTPQGTRYHTVMGRLLRETGLILVQACTRSQLMKVIDNLAAVTTWRDALPEAERM